MNTYSQESFQETVPQTSKVKGVIGSLIGAIIGTIPMMLLALLFGYLIGWLGVLTSFCAYKGYIIGKGVRDISFAKKTIMVCSISVLCLSTAFVVFIAIILTGGQVDISSSLVTIPIASGVLGYGIVRRKIERYSDPEGHAKYVENAQQRINSDTGTTFYFPESQRAKGNKISFLFSALIPLGLVFIALYLANNPNFSTDSFGNSVPLIIAAAVSLLAALINMSVLCSHLLFSEKALQHCFVKTQENELYLINIIKLNTTETYHYSLKNVNPQKFTTEEDSLFRSAVIRAIDDIKSSHIMPNHLIHTIVINMQNPAIISNNQQSAKIRYLNNKGKTKTLKTLKLYPDLIIADGVNMGTCPTQKFYLSPVITIAISVFSIVAGIALSLSLQ